MGSYGEWRAARELEVKTNEVSVSNRRAWLIVSKSVLSLYMMRTETSSLTSDPTLRKHFILLVGKVYYQSNVMHHLELKMQSKTDTQDCHWPLNNEEGLGVLNLHSRKLAYNFLLSWSLTTNSILLIRSLSDNINSRLIHILYVIYIHTHTYI